MPYWPLSGGNGASNHYNLIATHTGGQQALPQNTLVRVALVAVQDPSVSLAGNVYTAQTAGWYLCLASVAFQTASTATTVQADLRQNGSTKYRCIPGQPSNLFPQINVGGLLLLAVGDTIDLAAASNSAGVDVIDTDVTGCFLTIAYLGVSS
jgi:hypothetical protein